MADAILEKRREALGALQREQIIEGFAEATGEKGYSAATIADIVRRAHVSKSTFYEHFADKEAVYLALHASVAETLAAALIDSLDRTLAEPEWRERVRHLVATNLEVIASNPSFLAQVRIEPQIASEGSAQVRLEAAYRFVQIYERLAGEIAESTEEVEPVPGHVALAGMATGVAFIGATAVEGPDAVRALEEPLTDIWVRLLRRG